MTLEAELEALAAKYRTLHELRARREEAEGAGASGFEGAEAAERRARFRELGRRFPGSLRELEVTPAAELAARLALVEAELAELRAGASRERPSRPLVALVLDFHRTLRTSLAVKSFLAGRGGAVDEACVAAYERHRQIAGLPPGDRAFLEAHRAPPGGRLVGAVLAAVAARHGTTPAGVERAIFGRSTAASR